MNTRWLRPLIVVPIAILVSAFLSGVARADDWKGAFNFLYGKRVMDSKDWAPVDRLDTYGFEVTWGKQDAPILFATDLYGSLANDLRGDQRFKSRVFEFAFGLRKIWELKVVKPYFGAGVSYFYDRLSGPVAGGGDRNDTDRTTGFWLGGGAVFRLGQHVNLGAALRYSPSSTVRLLGPKVNGTSTVFGVTVGWAWGTGKKK